MPATSAESGNDTYSTKSSAATSPAFRMLTSYVDSLPTVIRRGPVVSMLNRGPLRAKSTPPWLSGLLAAGVFSPAVSELAGGPSNGSAVTASSPPRSGFTLRLATRGRPATFGTLDSAFCSNFTMVASEPGVASAMRPAWTVDCGLSSPNTDWRTAASRSYMGRNAGLLGPADSSISACTPVETPDVIFCGRASGACRCVISGRSSSSNDGLLRGRRTVFGVPSAARGTASVASSNRKSTSLSADFSLTAGRWAAPVPVKTLPALPSLA